MSDVESSLRDLIPALTGKMFRQQQLSKSDSREFWAQVVYLEPGHFHGFWVPPGGIRDCCIQNGSHSFRDSPWRSG